MKDGTSMSRQEYDRRQHSVGMPGTRGRATRVRISGRRHSARIRRAQGQQDPSHSGAPRAGSDAHGRWLRARQRAGGSRRCHLWPGRHQHGHWNRHGHARFVAHRLHHRPGGKQVDRVGCVSGDRHHRRHSAHHQAQLSGDARERSGAHDSGSVLCGALRPARAGAGRYHQRRAAVDLRIRLGSRQAATAGIPSGFVAGAKRI